MLDGDNGNSKLVVRLHLFRIKENCWVVSRRATIPFITHKVIFPEQSHVHSDPMYRSRGKLSGSAKQVIKKTREV